MIIFINCRDAFIWSVYIFPKIMKLFVEAPYTLRKLPIILVYIFGEVLLGSKNIIGVKPNGNFPIYIFACQQWALTICYKR